LAGLTGRWRSGGAFSRRRVALRSGAGVAVSVSTPRPDVDREGLDRGRGRRGRVGRGRIHGRHVPSATVRVETATIHGHGDKHGPRLPAVSARTTYRSCGECTRLRAAVSTVFGSDRLRVTGKSDGTSVTLAMDLAVVPFCPVAPRSVARGPGAGRPACWPAVSSPSGSSSTTTAAEPSRVGTGSRCGGAP